MAVMFRGQLSDLSLKINRLVKVINDNNYKRAGDVIYLESFTSLCYNKPEDTDSC